jgi:hypothetical protein
VVQSIRTRIARARTTAINVIADTDEGADMFGGSAEYDVQVIEEYLRSQGKAGGPST